MLNASMVGADEPSFEECRHAVHTGQELVGEFLRPTDVRDLVTVAQLLQTRVARPPICMNFRSWPYGSLDKRKQTVPADVVESANADPTESSAPLLCRHHHDSLALRLPAMYTLFGAPDVRFIDLDDTVKPIATGANHRETQFVQPCPRSPVTPQSKHPPGDPTHSRRSFGW